MNIEHPTSNAELPTQRREGEEAQGLSGSAMIEALDAWCESVTGVLAYSVHVPAEQKRELVQHLMNLRKRFRK